MKAGPLQTLLCLRDLRKVFLWISSPICHICKGTLESLTVVVGDIFSKYSIFMPMKIPCVVEKVANLFKNVVSIGVFH